MNIKQSIRFCASYISLQCFVFLLIDIIVRNITPRVYIWGAAETVAQVILAILVLTGKIEIYIGK